MSVTRFTSAVSDSENSGPVNFIIDTDSKTSCVGVGVNERKQVTHIVETVGAEGIKGPQLLISEPPDGVALAASPLPMAVSIDRFLATDDEKLNIRRDFPPSLKRALLATLWPSNVAGLVKGAIRGL